MSNCDNKSNGRDTAMRLLIKNGHLLNPKTKVNEPMDILIENEKIVSIEKEIKCDPDKDIEIISADGCYVMPGFIDMHVHLRDPGFTHKETIETGAKAAAKGGFTTICAMPNTKPVTDNAKIVEEIVNRAKDEACIHVLPVGAITIGQAGKEITDIKAMAAKGICAISEDGKSVMDSNIYREAMRLAKECNIPVLAHCEDINLVAGGVMNDDDKARTLGLKGISNAVEDVIVARDILLAKETGVRLHLCHCSTKDSVKMIDEAKKDGLPVTGEVCPHHFTLSTEDIKENDANYKMNPPLRKPEDVQALKDGLHNNIMDVISTDHAPHSAEEKSKGFEKAPFGIVGLETSAALTYTELVKKGYLTPMQMAEKMSYNPAQVLGIDRGNIEVGKVADLAIFDPNTEYEIDVTTFVSKGHNSPFDGKKVQGLVKYTIYNGKVVYKN